MEILVGKIVLANIKRDFKTFMGWEPLKLKFSDDSTSYRESEGIILQGNIKY